MYAVLGSHSPLHGQASGHSRRSPGDFELLPISILRSDVFRLRWRISLRRVGGARAWQPACASPHRSLRWHRMKTVAVTGSFDNLRSKHVRFLEEASKFGNVHVALWSDETCQAIEGRPPKFPRQERLYLLQTLRFVENVTLVGGNSDSNTLREANGIKPDLWVFEPENDPARKRMNIEDLRAPYHIISDADLRGLHVPAFVPAASDPTRKRVIVTGCYDWFHSGHVRFFEEASALGDLFVVVGHDANIALLKGHGHPL